MDPDYNLEKLRDIEEEDVVRLLALRAPGEEYKSIHPPLEEMEEPECAVREMVEPTEGAKAGDRIRCVQFTDSMQFAPITPRQRALSAYNRYRGVDIGVSSGGTILEARERDIEKIAKELIDSETFDTARTGLRGRTLDGHAVRLNANGMMFDALRRWAIDERTGDVKYVKNMMAGAMDKDVVLGTPLPEFELHKRTTMYGWNAGRGGVWQEVDDPESMDVISEIHWKRTVGGFQPWKKISEIKGGKKDIGVKNLKLFFPIKGLVSKKEVLKEGSRQWGNISDLTDTFERTRNLKPEEMLTLIESKKYAIEKEKEDMGWGQHHTTINRLEKKYYKDASIPKGLEKLLQEELLTIEEARKSFAEFSELINGYPLREEHIKAYLMMLEKSLITADTK